MSSNCDSCLFSVQVEHEELERYKKAIDKAVDMLCRMKKATDCWEFHSDCPFISECELGMKQEDGNALCYSKEEWNKYLFYEQGK